MLPKNTWSLSVGWGDRYDSAQSVQPFSSTTPVGTEENRSKANSRKKKNIHCLTYTPAYSTIVITSHTTWGERHDTGPKAQRTWLKKQETIYRKLQWQIATRLGVWSIDQPGSQHPSWGRVRSQKSVSIRINLPFEIGISPYFVVSK